MRGSSLVPRDSAAPEAWEVDDGDGDLLAQRRRRAATTYADPASGLSEPADWTLRITDDDGDELDRASGDGEHREPSPGRRTRAASTTARYRWTLEATDGWGNGPLHESGSFRVDTTAPIVSVAGLGRRRPPVQPERRRVRARPSGSRSTRTSRAPRPPPIRNEADEVVARVSADLGAGGATLAWDGTDDDGNDVPDGAYRLSITARDRAGNRSEPVVRDVVAYAALGFTGASAPVFFPQDGDSAREPGHVLVPPRVAGDGRLDDRARGRDRRAHDRRRRGTRTPASHAFAWDGTRRRTARWCPRGAYRAVVTATDGALAATQRASVVADAFRITASDATPGRGQKITVTAVSAEVLDGAPRLRVFQPGRDAWSVRMDKVGAQDLPGHDHPQVERGGDAPAPGRGRRRPGIRPELQPVPAAPLIDPGRDRIGPDRTAPY